MSQDDRGWKKGLSRRNLLKTGAASIAAALGGGDVGIPAVAAQKPGDAGDVDLVFVNGKIHTMDAGDTVVSSVGIGDGRFAEVGNGAKGQGPNKRVVNLQGRTVVPGIIDNHNHLVLMGNRPGYHTPLENAYSIADVQAIYAARAQGVPPGKWITTIGGFHQNHFVMPSEIPRLPTLAELDAAVPNHPVFILQGFSGPSTTNTVGKQFFETNGVVVGANGLIAAGGGVGNAVSGRALNLLRQTLLRNAPDGFEQRKRSVGEAM